MTRVLVVDDHDFFRGCVVDLVQASGDLDAVGECADGAEVVQAVAELHPDVVLMDVRMGAVSGLEALAALHRAAPAVRVIMLTSDGTESTRVAARASGAAGFLVKGSDVDLVLDAVRQVARGGTAWPEDLHAGLTPAC